MDIKKIILKVASKSKCKKRKVGAVITSGSSVIVKACNYEPGDRPCEDENGKTRDSVVHAEIAALALLAEYPSTKALTMYVTHTPCYNCTKVIEEAGITNVVIVEAFMKFDSGKLRYSLIPPIVTKALASVLTYGAKKYKANNWQDIDDIDRYWDALYRHLEARRAGEIFDSESKMPHLWHALTNISFILFLDNK